MDEATRPRARGSLPMSTWCHERAYARRVWKHVSAGCSNKVEKLSWVEEDGCRAWVVVCGGPMVDMYLAYDLRHDVLRRQWPAIPVFCRRRENCKSPCGCPKGGWAVDAGAGCGRDR